MFCGTSSPVAALLLVCVVARPFCTTTPLREVCTCPLAIIVSMGVVVGSSATLCCISTGLLASTTSRTVLTSVLSTRGDRSVALITATLSARAEFCVLLLTITRSFRCGNICR
uniref:Secreted protein n=1 Tax=Anopheles darlingi TaxID=43151 RepID=A0A2M4DRT9_ANODA